MRLRKGKDLSQEDRDELKRLWRQASKLCHPDLVADDLKEEANAMMVQLNGPNSVETSKPFVLWWRACSRASSR